MDTFHRPENENVSPNVHYVSTGADLVGGKMRNRGVATAVVFHIFKMTHNIPRLEESKMNSAIKKRNDKKKTTLNIPRYFYFALRPS